MEEGYLAKIVQGDGAKEIKVGEVSILLSKESIIFLHIDSYCYPDACMFY
jgi:hypothetical protein